MLLTTSCAYQFGYGERTLPGGYKQVAIPVFANKTGLIGAEAGFTNALRREFARSRVSDVVEQSTAPAFIEGEVTKIDFVHGAQIVPNSPIAPGDSLCVGNFPCYTVLTAEYRVLVEVTVKFKRASDGFVLWDHKFFGERVYTSPQVGLPVVNTVNSLYNHSARKEVVELLAKDMMSEAHSRITENF
jgi:hypothetical protein